MPVKDHVHKLKGYKNTKGEHCYFCVDDFCTFKSKAKLLLGKLNVCWICEKDFKLTPYSYQLDKPHCPECHKPRIRLNEIVEQPAPVLSLKQRLDLATRNAELSGQTNADQEPVIDEEL